MRPSSYKYQTGLSCGGPSLVYGAQALEAYDQFAQAS